MIKPAINIAGHAWAARCGVGRACFCNDVVAHLGAEHLQLGLADEDGLDELAARTDVITWEIEHIAAVYLAELESRGINVQPSPNTLRIIQDKLAQKQFLTKLGRTS